MEIAAVIAIVIAAFGIVMIPVFRGRAADAHASAGAADLETEILRYRASLRADSICARCGQANPQGSRFCYECGRSLPARDREEFEGTGASE
jgi:hypothetical protein